MVRSVRKLSQDSDGSVAPTVGLMIFALVAAGGLAFDYARMATMDSELQDAADQAALAAASQLTGDTGACARAAAAAANLVSNLTLMANDSLGQAIIVPNEGTCDAVGQIRFYRDVNKTQAATSDAEAEFVEVEVNPRTARFALTPVVQAFSSGPIRAIAFATLGEAYCKVPPVMICNPQETSTNLDFDFTALDGVGLRLVSVGGGSGSWAPGNFGYLDMAGLSNGATGLREGLGWGNPPIACIPGSGLDTKPGATVTVTGAINTRFDVYDSSVDCPDGGTCPASINSVKDFVRSADAGTNGNGCGIHNSGWGLPASGYYGSGSIPSSATVPLDPSVIPAAMGHPRDMCHSVDPSVAGACTGPIGNGSWDRDAYFRTNYVRADGTRWSSADWQTNTGLGPTPRRYDVYLWEIENAGDLVDGVRVLDPTPPTASGSDKIARGLPICSPAEGYGSGQVPDADTPDRRKITVAIVNCIDQSVNGNSVDIQTVGWLEAFLVEPSYNRARTSSGDVYVEVVGGARQGVQLVSKKVPYLIE